MGRGRGGSGEWGRGVGPGAWLARAGLTALGVAGVGRWSVGGTDGAVGEGAGQGAWGVGVVGWLARVEMGWRHAAL